MIKMILSADEGNAIGWSDGRLAYPSLKKDMARFKELTSGHAVLMGFNTFMSLNRLNGLPNRKNIVLTTRPQSEACTNIGQNVDILSSLEMIKTNKPQGLFKDLWIIGGKSVYEQSLSLGLVDEIYLTVVHGNCNADVKLDTDLVAWKLFVLRQAKIGIRWHVEVQSVQQDGEFQTSYVKMRNLNAT
jgi:dihydrofolate reductase